LFLLQNSVKGRNWILYNMSALNSELNKIVTSRDKVYMILVINQLNAQIIAL